MSGPRAPPRPRPLVTRMRLTFRNHTTAFLGPAMASADVPRKPRCAPLPGAAPPWGFGRAAGSRRALQSSLMQTRRLPKPFASASLHFLRGSPLCGHRTQAVFGERARPMGYRFKTSGSLTNRLLVEQPAYLPAALIFRATCGMARWGLLLANRTRSRVTNAIITQCSLARLPLRHVSTHVSPRADCRIIAVAPSQPRRRSNRWRSNPPSAELGNAPAIG